MANHEKEYHHELEDLKQELEHFQQEKERVRAILGKVGGMPQFRAKIINIIFIVIIVISIVLSIVGKKEWQLHMVELATIALSLKIIYLIHLQMKVNHFQFWILSSLEWRLNEMMKLIKNLKDD